MKPLLKWVGGKRKFAPMMQELWTTGKFKRYIEPFVGSGAVYFHLEPKKALLNDLCDPLMTLYMVVQQYTEEFLHKYKSVCKQYSPMKESDYYRARKSFNRIKIKSLEDEVRRAALFLYFNKSAFQGLWRVNLSGQFNVPFGGYKTNALPSSERVRSVAELLKGAKLSNSGFEYALNQAKKGDLVYCDSPYWEAFSSYTGKRFRVYDHRHLASLAYDAVCRGATVVISNRECKEIKKLYAKNRGWKWKSMKQMQSMVPTRAKNPEMVISSCALRL